MPQFDQHARVFRETRVSNASRKLEIDVGGDDASAVIPEARTKHFDDEFGLTFGPALGEFTETSPTERDGVVEWAKGNRKARIYEIAGFENGGTEIEVEFSAKPGRNTYDFPFRAKGLTLHHQGPLSQEQLDEGSTREDTDSFAVYCDKRHNRAGGMEYRTGKVMHIPRPVIWTRTGKRVNGSWDRRAMGDGILRAVMPQAFLDQLDYAGGEYPILGPTLGYSTEGGSSATAATFGSSSNRRGNGYEMPEDGDVTEIHAYFRTGAASAETLDLFAAVNEVDSVASGQHGEIVSAENTSETIAATGPTQVDWTLSTTSLTGGTDYLLNMVGDSSDLTATNVNIRWDSGSPDSRYQRNYATYSTSTGHAKEDPYIDALSNLDTVYSIWITYTAAAGGPKGPLGHPFMGAFGGPV